MARARRFRQVDVFSVEPYRGNPLAVVVDGEGLTVEEMERFASWTNLSETTFVLPPTAPGADYRVRIFTPSFEIPFAGHPTLGTCHAWLESGGTPHRPDVVVQECGVGLVHVRRASDALAFAAPPLIRSGAVDEHTLNDVARILRLDRTDIVAAQWVDNGPGWVGVLLPDADAVLAVEPGPIGDRLIGVVGRAPDEAEHRFEVRAFFPVGASTVEDPVTGSLNASLAQWLIGAGIAPPHYRVRQGTAIGRAGTVEIESDGRGTVWVGGRSTTCVVGHVVL